MVGLDDVRDLAHAMEDVLAQARTAGRRSRRSSSSRCCALRTRCAGTSPATTMPDAGSARGPRREPGERLRTRRRTTRPPPRNGARRARAAERRALRVPPEKIDRLLDLVGETVLHGRRLEHVLGDERSSDGETVSDELDLGERLFGELQDAAIEMRTLPLASITAPLPRAVRDIATAGGQGRRAGLISGAETELDRVILESLSEPLVHMLRNAVAHGIETPERAGAAGKPPRATSSSARSSAAAWSRSSSPTTDAASRPSLIEEARRHGSLADVLARPGFSTAAEVTELSGRGVGLDAVKRYVEWFGGSARGAKRARQRHARSSSCFRSRSRCSRSCWSSAAATCSACRSRASRRRSASRIRSRSRAGSRSSSAADRCQLADLADLVGAARTGSARRLAGARRLGRSGGGSPHRAIACSARRRSSSSRSARCSPRRPRLPRRRDPRRRPHRAAPRPGRARPRASGEQAPPRAAPVGARAAARRRRCSSSRTRSPCASSSAASSRRPATASRPPATAARRSTALQRDAEIDLVVTDSRCRR